MKYLLPDKVYTVLKWAGLIALPAIAACVNTIGSAAGWIDTGLCVTVINAVGTCIGALICISGVTAKEGEDDDA